MNNADIIISLKSEVAGQCACEMTRAVSRTITRRYDEALKSTGLRTTQFTILTVIALSKDETLTDLAHTLSTERSTIIRNLKLLERDGYIEMTGSGQGKAHKAKITDKGLEVLAECLPLWHGAQDALKNDLGHEVWANVTQNLRSVKQKAI